MNKVKNSNLFLLILLMMVTSCSNAENTQNVSQSQHDDQKDVVLAQPLIEQQNIKQQPQTVKQETDTNNSIQPIESTPVLTCQQVDSKITKELQISFENSGYNWDGSQPTDHEKTKQSNHTIKNTLMGYAQLDDSFDCVFPLASEEGLSIQTSDDKKLRTYAWDKNTGGTMHDYAGFYQFKDTQGNIHLQDKGDNNENSLPSGLFTDTFNGKVTYIMVLTGVYSTKDQSQLLQAFTINGDTMQAENIIHTSNITNSLSFNYDFFSVVARPERPIQLFEYDKNSKTLRFPVVVADDEYPSGKVTNKFIEYTFDGQYFQRVKN